MSSPSQCLPPLPPCPHPYHRLALPPSAPTCTTASSRQLGALPQATSLRASPACTAAPKRMSSPAMGMLLAPHSMRAVQERGSAQQWWVLGLGHRPTERSRETTYGTGTRV